jgi:hypothetical protein
MQVQAASRVAEANSERPGFARRFKLGAEAVVPIHGVCDQARLGRLRRSILERGWEGDPLLAFGLGNASRP